MIAKKPVPIKKVPKAPEPKFEGKGTKARLNTAAEKFIFNQRSSN